VRYVVIIGVSSAHALFILAHRRIWKLTLTPSSGLAEEVDCVGLHDEIGGAWLFALLQGRLRDRNESRLFWDWFVKRWFYPDRLRPRQNGENAKRVIPTAGLFSLQGTRRWPRSSVGYRWPSRPIRCTQRAHLPLLPAVRVWCSLRRSCNNDNEN
jgi:hypothetical protein